MTYTGYDDPIYGTLLDNLNDTVQKYTALSSELAAADGDRDKAVESWMDSTDNPAAVKLRAQVEQAMAKLKELAEKNVVDKKLSDEDKEKAKVELNGLKDQVRSGHQAITMLTGTMGTDPEGVKAALVAIGDPTRTGKGRKAGSTGSSLPRASVLVTVNGGNLKDEKYDSFSKVATALGCEVKDLQEAFAKAAGVEPMNIKTVDKSVTFEFQVNEQGSVYTLSTTPKPRAKPGPRGKTETVSEESKTEEAA